jgi:hypothetical protein
MFFAGKWMELESFVLCEISQVQKISKVIRFLSHVEARPVS